MELLLDNGDYVRNEYGGFKTVEGADELLGRILYKLTVKRGAFPLIPELGSRLYMLPREKKSARKSAAFAYIEEAVADEEEVKLENVEITENEEKLFITANFIYNGENLQIKLEV